MTNAHTVFLRGGLGNQFFQWMYALSFKAAEHPVALDTSFLQSRRGNQALGHLELNSVFHTLHMPVTCRLAFARHIEPVFTRVAHALAWLDVEGAQPSYIPGRPFHHYGYYQTPANFRGAVRRWILSSIKPELRDGSLLPPSLRNRPYLAVHIRGGDYMQGDYNFAQIGLLSADYYRDALLAVDPGTRVLLVSDDYDRAGYIAESVALRDRDIVSLRDLAGEKETPLLALAAMMGATHLITANSSFSALAGYCNSGATIKFPQPWFRGTSLTRVSPSLPHWSPVDSAFETSPSGNMQ